MKIFLMEQVAAYQNYYEWQAYPLVDPVQMQTPLFNLKVYVLDILPEMRKWFGGSHIHAYLHSFEEGPWDYSLIHSLLKDELENFSGLEFAPEDFFVIS